ncbi:MAG: 50S ribosome-binding GTPase [Sedimentisphaerales bacterium]|nr:50S ribosome-binding GTPase [Sedimentisphaerales bacterium]
MGTFAAVTTDKGTGAISTVEVFGDHADNILKKIFIPLKGKAQFLKPGTVTVGQIRDKDKTIDQVTIGCQWPDSFSINCHGNPLIVEMIAKLLKENKVEILIYEQLLQKIYSKRQNYNAIQIEAKIALTKAKTISGARIIIHQQKNGLSYILKHWLEKTGKISLAKIKNQSHAILKASKVAKFIIYGCKAVVAGPANTGKSTLFNCLCGANKAIVTDIKGTTRDWLSAQYQFGSLMLELTDTAGLDDILNDEIQAKAQEKSIQMVTDADLILLVLNQSRANTKISGELLKRIANKKILTVLNKSDLPGELNTSKLPIICSQIIRISAKYAQGIEDLAEKIQEILGVAKFDFYRPVCFTERQNKLVAELAKAGSKTSAANIITELLNGPVCV